MTASESEWYNKWQRMTTSGKTSDKEWQRVTMSDNEWQRMTTSDNEWQRVVQRVIKSDNVWYNEWEQMAMSDSEWQE